MTETILAAAIEVGHHETAKWFGFTVNTDTVLATAIAALIVIGLAFFLRAKVTSTGVPGGVQLFWEAITVQLRDQIETAIGMKIAPFVLPLAVTLAPRASLGVVAAGILVLGTRFAGIGPALRTMSEMGPGCVKTPMSNLRVELPSRFRRYGSRLYWQLLSEEGN